MRPVLLGNKVSTLAAGVAPPWMSMNKQCGRSVCRAPLQRGRDGVGAPRRKVRAPRFAPCGDSGRAGASGQVFSGEGHRTPEHFREEQGVG